MVEVADGGGIMERKEDNGWRSVGASHWGDGDV